MLSPGAMGSLGGFLPGVRDVLGIPFCFKSGVSGFRVAGFRVSGFRVSVFRVECFRVQA